MRDAIKERPLQILGVSSALLVALVAGIWFAAPATSRASTVDVIHPASTVKLAHYAMDVYDDQPLYCWQSPDGMKGECSPVDATRGNFPR